MAEDQIRIGTQSGGVPGPPDSRTRIASDAAVQQELQRLVARLAKLDQRIELVLIIIRQLVELQNTFAGTNRGTNARAGIDASLPDRSSDQWADRLVQVLKAGMDFQ